MGHLTCLYHVRREHGPWKKGWWVSWDMTADEVPLIALLDPSDPSTVVGTFEHNAIPHIFTGLVEGTMTLEATSPVVAQLSSESLRDVADYRSGLEVA